MYKFRIDYNRLWDLVVDGEAVYLQFKRDPWETKQETKTTYGVLAVKDDAAVIYQIGSSLNHYYYTIQNDEGKEAFINRCEQLEVSFVDPDDYCDR